MNSNSESSSFPFRFRRSKFCPECGAPVPQDSEVSTCATCGASILIPEIPNVDQTIQYTGNTRTTPASSRSSSSWSGQTIGDYAIKGEIARGGMGVVYRAHQLSLDRPVALKMILPGNLATDHEVARFMSEAKAAASLDHPHIVPVYDMGELEGQFFYSMALIEGESLEQRLGRERLDQQTAAELVRDIAEGMTIAHDSGVIHRDLKPANILFDAEGRPRVTDFGLAKKMASNHDLTEAGQTLGTPSYMPPEQAAGQIDRIGPTADVYSLGAILFTCLTGRPPFESQSIFETLKQVVEREPALPRDFDATIDRDLEAICLKCLQKSPADRYESAKTLHQDLIRYLAHEPVQARSLSALEKAMHWRRMIKNNPDVRIQSQRRICGVPLVSISFGKDHEKQETTGHAIGVIAIGDKSTGVLAIGGNARGVLAYGLRATGVIAFGALAMGVVPIGGVSLGLFSLGGLALGYQAFGCIAVGVKTIGLVGIGHNVLAAFRWVVW